MWLTEIKGLAQLTASALAAVLPISRMGLPTRSESALREQLEAIQRSHQQELKELQAQARTESDGLRRQQAMDEGETLARARDELRAELRAVRGEPLGQLALEALQARRRRLHLGALAGLLCSRDLLEVES